MGTHDFTLTVRQSASTSAEPNFESPWGELRICSEVVSSDRLAAISVDDVPLLTEDEKAALALDPSLLEVARDRLAARRHFIALGQAWTRQEVERAAFRVEQAVQERLWALGGPGAVVQDARFRAALWNAQYQAHEAVFAKTGSRVIAKTIQREASAGREPLTLCRGRQLRRLPKEVLRKHAPDLLEHYGDNIVPLGYGDGCGVITQDSREPRPPKKYCGRCRAKAGTTMNAGLTKTARARLRASRNPRPR
jgi:hypothetical protein